MWRGEPSPGASGSTGGPSPCADEDTWTELQGMPPCAMLIEIIRAHARAGARMNSCTRDARGARDSSARAGCRRQHEPTGQITDRNVRHHRLAASQHVAARYTMLQRSTPCCNTVHPRVATKCSMLCAVDRAASCGRAGGPSAHSGRWTRAIAALQPPVPSQSLKPMHPLTAHARTRAHMRRTRTRMRATAHAHERCFDCPRKRG